MIKSSLRAAARILGGRRAAAGEGSNVVTFAPMQIPVAIQQPAKTADASGLENGDRKLIDRQTFERALTDYESFRNSGSPHSPREEIRFAEDGIHFEKLTFPFAVSLASRRLEYRLCFYKCTFDQAFDARWARVDSLSIKRCHLKKQFDGMALETRGSVDFFETRSSSQINLSVARIRGDLLLIGAYLFYGEPEAPIEPFLEVQKGAALFAPGVRVHSVLMDRVTTKGRIFLDACVLTGILKAGDARLERETRSGEVASGRWDHMVLSASSSNIEGAVILGEEAIGQPDRLQDFSAYGQVSFCNSRIGGDFVCTNGRFHSAFLGCKAERVRQLTETEPPLDFTLLASLDVSRTRIEGGVWLDRGFEARGAVLFNSAEIKGAFYSAYSDLNAALPECGPPSTQMTKRHPFTIALSMDRAQIGNTLRLNSGFKAFGEVNLRNAVISGDVDCQGGHFCGCWPKEPHPAGHQPEALTLSGASIDGSVFMTDIIRKKLMGGSGAAEAVHIEFNGFISQGQVRLRGTSIERNLHLGGGLFKLMPAVADEESSKHSPEQQRVGWFHSTRVAGTTFLKEEDRPSVCFEGSVSFENMRTDGWVDSLASWPQCWDPKHKCPATIELNGLTYNKLSGPTRGEERLMWLLHQPARDLQPAPISNVRDSDDENPADWGFKTQPWEQCAQILYDLGYHRDARYIWRMEQRFLRVKGRQARSEKFLNLLLGTFVGHGYGVVFTLLWALWLVGLGAIVADYGQYKGYMVPSQGDIVVAAADHKEWARLLGEQHDWVNPPRGYPEFHPVFYSMDVALPAGNLRQAENWIAVDTPNSDFEAPLPSILLDTANPWFGCSLLIVIGVVLTWSAAAVIWLRWLRAEATIRFPSTHKLSPRDHFGLSEAKALYFRRLNDNSRHRDWIAQGTVALMLLTALAATGIYLLNSLWIFEYLDCWDWLSQHIAHMSFPHVFSIFETLAGWLLITAIAIGLGAAVFRRTE
jgi:hypothetical protein